MLAETLDPQTFRATVTFSVRDDIKLPADSSAAIVSTSLLGGKYPRRHARRRREDAPARRRDHLTQSSINLEDLIGRFIYGGGSGGAKPGGQGAPAAGGQDATDPFATGGGGAQPQGAGQAPK